MIERNSLREFQTAGCPVPSYYKPREGSIFYLIRCTYYKFLTISCIAVRFIEMYLIAYKVRITTMPARGSETAIVTLRRSQDAFNLIRNPTQLELSVQSRISAKMHNIAPL